MTHRPAPVDRDVTGIPARTVLVCLLSAATLLGGCATVAPPAAGPRPAQWASPLAVTGLPNLYRVNASLYRSAQPSREGFAAIGTGAHLVDGDPPIRTVISLRPHYSDASLAGTPSAVHLERISFQTWRPEDDEVVEFLRIATDPALQPVLVHCIHGADRTGTMVAIYRIVVEGWTKAQALSEMTQGGFGFHPIWQNLIRYIEDLDVDSIRAQLAAGGP